MTRRYRTLAVAAFACLVSIAEHASADDCIGLGACSVRVRFRRLSSQLDKIKARCNAVQLPVPVDPVRDGMTIAFGDDTSPDCLVIQANPSRLGRCWIHRTTDTSGRKIAVRLCQRSSGYRLRVSATNVDLQCLTRPTVHMRVAIGSTGGGVTCPLAGKGACTADPCPPTTTTTSPTTSTTHISTTSSSTSSSSTTRVPTTTTSTSTTARPCGCPPGAPCGLRNGGRCTADCQCQEITYSCGVECTDHTGGIFRVFNEEECLNLHLLPYPQGFDCGYSGENGNVAQVPDPSGHCGLRNREFNNASAGHWPRYVCAVCNARMDAHRASASDNPVQAGGNCLSYRDVANAYCQQGTRGGLRDWFFGYCDP